MPFGLAAKSAPPWAWPLGGSAFFPNEGRPGAGVWRGAAQRRPAPPVGCFSSQTSAPLNPMLFQLGFARAAGCSYSSTTGPVAGLAGFRYPRVVARACARRSRLGPFRARPMAPAFAAALIVSWVVCFGGVHSLLLAARAAFFLLGCALRFAPSALRLSPCFFLAGDPACFCKTGPRGQSGASAKPGRIRRFGSFHILNACWFHLFFFAFRLSRLRRVRRDILSRLRNIENIILFIANGK